MPLDVLYVDDEKDLCENFEDLFSSPQVRVRTFTDPRLAVAAANQDPPDLAFLDFRLPELNGEQIARAMKREIPKYLITGDLAVRCDYPFVATFYKPYAFDEVKRVLDRYTAA
jgi:DNA-binding NtrC family response regulator